MRCGPDALRVSERDTGQENGVRACPGAQPGKCGRRSRGVKVDASREGHWRAAPWCGVAKAVRLLSHPKPLPSVWARGGRQPEPTGGTRRHPRPALPNTDDSAVASKPETPSPPRAASGGLRPTCRERDPGTGAGRRVRVQDTPERGGLRRAVLRRRWLGTGRRTTCVSGFNGGGGGRPDVGVYGNSTLHSVFLLV